MIRYKEEVDELDAGEWHAVRIFMHPLIRVTTTAELAKDEDSTWSIYIYGGNPMLEDEEMPFSMDDDVFDDILSEMMIQQVLGKQLPGLTETGRLPITSRRSKGKECTSAVGRKEGGREEGSEGEGCVKSQLRPRHGTNIATQQEFPELPTPT